MRLLGGDFPLFLMRLLGRLSLCPEGRNLAAHLSSILVSKIQLCPQISCSAINFDGPLLGYGRPTFGSGRPTFGSQLGIHRFLKLLREFGRALLLGVILSA
ncbi:MAG: hypothetical protein AW12_03132 [Candidatus Accumulibacter sp. BA-94]|nr:MAG: hypothetical protein AW12_03132 [Candidatus Accumulibacter sp. BA-94]